ncbi:histidine kinase N-terminal 7TM domain-containing protein [Patescibacteria group bacterium]
MDILLLTTIISSVGCLVLGIYTLKFNPKKKANQFFALFCFSILIFLLLDYWSLFTYDLFVIKLTVFNASYISLFLFLFAYFFSYGKMKKKFVIILVLLAVIISLIAISPFLFTGLYYVNGIPHPNIGVGMMVYAPYTVLINITALIILIRSLRDRNLLKRSQSQFIVLGLVLTMSIIIFSHFFAVNILKTSEYIPIGMISTLLFVSFSSYAMTRYRFLDVKVTFKKSIVYGGSIALFASIYALVLFSAYYVFKLQSIDVSPLIWFLLAVFIFILIFEFFRKRIKNFLDGIFFREEIDFTKFVSDSKMELNSTHELESFVIKLAGCIQESIAAPVTNIYIRQSHLKRYKSFFPQNSRHYIAFSDSAADDFDKHRGIKLFYEVQEQNIGKAIQKVMRKNRAQIYMTVGTEKELLAIILIGEHKNRRAFTKKDLEGLEEFQEIARSALPNLLYWQITIEGLKVGLVERAS